MLRASCIHKAGYTLFISCISTYSCTILWIVSWDCELISIHFSQYRRFCSSLILWETWREACRIVLGRVGKISIAWRERRNGRWEKWFARWFTKCHLYTSRFSRFTNIFSCSQQFDDKCSWLKGTRITLGTCGRPFADDFRGHKFCV